MKKIVFMLFVMVFSIRMVYGTENIYPMKELIRPSAIVVGTEKIYIGDKTTIKLYDLKDCKFKKKIGRKGEGPGEFIGFASPQIHPDFLLVSSVNKISYFSPTGDLFKEEKHNLLGSQIKSIKDKFVGFKIKRGKDDFYVVYNLYDSNLRFIKELHRGKWLRHIKKKRDLFEIFFYDTCEDKIVLAHRKDFVIDILDENGNVIHSIKQDYIPIPFTKRDKTAVIEYWGKNPPYKFAFDFIKKRTAFPKNYPPILTCKLDKNKIYVITYLKKNKKNECLIFDINGKYLKKIFIPLYIKSPLEIDPFTIDRSYLFQLIENYEKEIWELHISELK